ncbi:GTP 3',8-cyclase MoaA [Agaribacter marinus]|uniref:GTP 3',8-cyclase n=1 Tax=Agaribacter marinus TaxID=1431249 RepID=A0AA37SXD4_9ALTE|nr:GTP 3',8-cyclase MoaA [Agaribacter marinus]GLR69371.1 GTP 3',8-cyclase [Agaribacter marinus]
MLTDNFGRKFEYLRLSITDVCNFRCDYCLPDGYQCGSSRDFLSMLEIKTLVSAFAELGTKKIRITGGEPSLRKDLPDIIEFCAHTPGIERVALTTNGYKLERDIQTWRDAGLTHLNVSVDSIDPRAFESITGSKQLTSILDGIDKATALGLQEVKLNAVLLKDYTPQQLDAFFKYIKSRPISIRFIELMETGDNAEYFEKNHLSGAFIQTQLFSRGWIEEPRDALAGPAKVYKHPDYAGSIGLIMPYAKDFCNTCNRLRVSALGKLHLCLFAEQGISLRQSLISGDIEATTRVLQNAMGIKKLSHELHERFTGATTHLAMLGG